MNKIIISITTLFLLSMLNSCGSSSSRTTAPITSLIQGIAVDDLILNGIITGNNIKQQKLSSVRSSTKDGSYELTINDYIGIMVIEASCDKDSQLKSIDGVLSQCPLDTRLRTIANAGGRATPIVANISALTEVIYQRAVALSGGITITLSAYEQARAEIGEMFGVDAVNDNPEEGNYQSIIEAFNDVAETTNQSVQEVVTKFAIDASDGAIGSSISQEIAQAISENNISNNIADNNGTYTPNSGEIVASTSPEDLSKEMFRALRTETLTLLNYNSPTKNGVLDFQSEDLADSIKYFTLHIETAGFYQQEILEVIFDAIRASKTKSEDMIGDGAGFLVIVEKVSNNNWSYVFKTNSIYKGTIEVPSNNPDDYMINSNFTSLDFIFNGVIPEYKYNDINKHSDINSISYQTLLGNVQVSAESTDKIVTLMENTKLTNSDGTESIEIVKLQSTSNHLSDFTYRKLDFAIFEARVKDFYLKGNIEIPTYIYNSKIYQNGGYLAQRFIFNGEVLDTRNNTKVEAYPLDIEWKDASTITQAQYDFDKKDPAKEVYDSVENTVNSSHYTRLYDLSLQGNIIQEDQSSTNLNITYENFEDEHENTYVSYKHNETILNVRTAFSNSEKKDGVIYLSIPTGITAAFLFENGKIVETDLENFKGSFVLKDSVAIATIEYREGAIIVKYINDGSFETIL